MSQAFSLHRLTGIHAELSINPLASLLVRMLEGGNFRDFVKFLTAFSARAPAEAKARFMFECYDVDGDGIISKDDLQSVLQYLVAGQLSDEQMQTVLHRCLDQTGPNGVTVEHFLQRGGIQHLVSTVPQRR
jgi:Ca2+-binding EF-hand superfamily protein